MLFVINIFRFRSYYYLLSGIATKDDDDTGVFLEVVLCQLWEGRFRRRRTTMKTTEMTRDDEHKEDVVMRLMFETLCKGEPSSSSRHCCPRLARSDDHQRRPRQGQAGRIHHGRNNHGRGEDDGDDGTGHASVMTTTTFDCHTYNDKTTRIAI